MLLRSATCFAPASRSIRARGDMHWRFQRFPVRYGAKPRAPASRAQWSIARSPGSDLTARCQLRKTRAHARTAGWPPAIWDEDDDTIGDETTVGRIYPQGLDHRGTFQSFFHSRLHRH